MRNVDQKCWLLAESFVNDEDPPLTMSKASAIEILADAIQTTIENTLEDLQYQEIQKSKRIQEARKQLQEALDQ